MHITLLQPHRHAGRDYPAGSELDLPESKAAWLIALKTAERAPAAGTTTNAKAKD